MSTGKERPVRVGPFRSVRKQCALKCLRSSMPFASSLHPTSLASASSLFRPPVPLTDAKDASSLQRRTYANYVPARIAGVFKTQFSRNRNQYPTMIAAGLDLLAGRVEAQPSENREGYRKCFRV